MENQAPFEIIGAPVTLYVAPVGTAFPAVDEDPAAPWALVGTSGDRNYSEDGVTVQHSQTIAEFRAAGSTGPIKAFRKEEALMLSMEMADLSLEQYKLTLNGNTVTAVAAGVGTAGTKKLGLSRGFSVQQYALLARGVSPYGDAMAMQYEVPVAYPSGSPEVVFRKGEASMLAIEWTALEDPDAAAEDERFGRVVAQTDVAET